MKKENSKLKPDQPIEAPASQGDDYSSAILAEQVKLIYYQSHRALIVTLIVATALVFLFWGYVAEGYLLSWLIAIYLVTFARLILVRAYFQKKPSIAESAKWGYRFLCSVIIAGLLWGIAGSVFFISGDDLRQLFLAYLLGGMIAGAMATLSSYRGAFFAFSLPVVFPFTYQVFAHDSEIHIVTAFTFLLFVIAMGGISHRLYHTIADSLKFRFENSELLNRLVQSKKLLELRVAERTEALAIANDILHREKELFQVTLTSIGDAVITTDSNGKITFLNPIAEFYTGWSNQEAINLPLQQIFDILDTKTRKPIASSLEAILNIPENAKKHHECLLIHKDNHECIIDYSMAPILNEQNITVGSVLTFRDVTEQRKLTQKLAYQATHDSLTGLMNRKEFENRLNKILTSMRTNTTHSLLYLDLDRFKIINDTCGHSAGDELLRQVTTLLRSKLRTRDSLARLGGDEFGIILEHCAENEALQVSQTLLTLVRNFQFHWQNKIFTIGISIGLFPITHNHTDLTHVMNAADTACYSAKEHGRNRIHIFRNNTNQENHTNLTL